MIRQDGTKVPWSTVIIYSSDISSTVAGAVMMILLYLSVIIALASSTDGTSICCPVAVTSRGVRIDMYSIPLAE